jgi:hypothetical protein
MQLLSDVIDSCFIYVMNDDLVWLLTWPLSEVPTSWCGAACVNAPKKSFCKDIIITKSFSMETSFVLFNLFQAVPNETNDDDEVSKCHQAFEKEKV